MNNPMALFQQFQQFRQEMTPDGAKAKIEEMLKNGQMSESQYQNLANQAQSIMSFLRR